MIEPTDAQIAIFVGTKGAGKTFRIKRALARMQRPWVVWDLQGAYASVAGARLWRDVREFASHLASGGTIEREVFACPSWQFDAWCSWVFATGHLVCVIEELGRYCSSGAAPAPLRDLFDRNRHADIWLCCAAARIARIPKDVMAQADDVCISRVRLPNDAKYVAEMFGDDAAARVRNLPPHRFLRLRS